MRALRILVLLAVLGLGAPAASGTTIGFGKSILQGTSSTKPTSLQFGPDDRLYVAQSMLQRILVMEPRPGTTPAVHCTLPRGYPDGFCFDATGRLYVAGSLGDVLVVFAPDGTVDEVVEMGAGSEPTNCCLGDGVLYVTLAGSGQLVSLATPVEPLALHPSRR